MRLEFQTDLGIVAIGSFSEAVICWWRWPAWVLFAVLVATLMALAGRAALG